MKYFLSIFALAVCFLLYFSLNGVAPEKRVTDDFKKEHPTYRIIDVQAGEGDSDTAYYLIKYRKPNDERIYAEEWQYMNQGQAGWDVTHKQLVEGT